MEIENSTEFQALLSKSKELEGGMGAVAFAVLEMFRRGGMPESEVEALHSKMKTYFMVPTNAECNAILAVVLKRLASDKLAENGSWYPSNS